MFERCTGELRKVLSVARWAVEAGNALEMDPEHLLAAAMYVVPSCLGHDRGQAILLHLGYPEVLHAPGRHTRPQISFSARTRQCLADAAARADRLGHRWVRTEHLLATLAAEAGSDAARALQTARVDASALDASALARAPRDDQRFDTGPSLQVLVTPVGARPRDAV